MNGKVFLQQDSGLRGLADSKMRLHAFLPAALCFAMIWPFGGGWNKTKMMAGDATPGARGVVQYKSGDNTNTALDIKVSSLAPPSSLTPSENDYVVWIESPGHAPQNLGQLKVDGNEQGELNTETPYKRFRVFITAEENPRLQMPTGPKILSADVSRS